VTAEQETAQQQGLRARLTSNRGIGLLLVVLAVVAIYAVYHKQQIAATLKFGNTITAVFTQSYKLDPYHDDVKLAGVVVGTVTGADYDQQSSTSTVSMKLDTGVLDKLGTAPSAYIRPTLVLGGKYYVDLIPGGNRGRFDGGQIPVQRTRIPVELDRVLSSLTAPALTGIQTSIRQLDGTLRAQGKEALRGLVNDAPSTLGPASQVLRGAEGTDPDHDLTAVVSGFDNVSRAFTRNDAQVARITDALKDTTAALAAESGAVRSAAAKGPDTLRATRAGLLDLQPTLRKLAVTADSFRPSAQELDPFLAKLDPVLRDTRPLVSDLKPLLVDLRPTVHDLNPTADKATDALDDLRGPVLDRINGPIRQTVFAPFHGTAPYNNGGAGEIPLFHEIGYLLTALDGSFQYKDANGGAARLEAGIARNSLGGSAFPRTAEEQLEQLGLQQPKGPQAPPPVSFPLSPPVPQPIVPTQGANGPGLPKYPSKAQLPDQQKPGSPGIPLLGGMTGGSR
jgi:phospholipid/cholesterol/gamma-HCH transport system substrate-binding protein